MPDIKMNSREKTMSYNITTPHDACFKSFFTREPFVKDFIRCYIPEEIKAHLDMDTLVLDSGSFVAEEFKSWYSDVIATLQLTGSRQELELYFLFEHKSRPDRFARLQTLNYQVQKWLHLYRTDRLETHLPIIVPVVIYHGKNRWSYSAEFSDYFDIPTETFRDFIPAYRHILHDITHMGDEAFKTSILMEIFHLLFKYIHYPELDVKIQEIYDLLEKMPDQAEAVEYLKIIIRYVLEAGQISPDRLARHTRKFTGGETMVGVAYAQIQKEVAQQYAERLELAEMLTQQAQLEVQQAQVKAQQAELNKSRDMLIKSLKMKFGFVKPRLVERIKAVSSMETLDDLFELTFKCSTLENFIEYLDAATSE